MLRDVKTKKNLFRELKGGRIRGTFLDLIMVKEGMNGRTPSLVSSHVFQFPILLLEGLLKKLELFILYSVINWIVNMFSLRA